MTAWQRLLERLRLQPWQLWLDEPAGGAANMERDENLLDSCEGPVLRLYGWSEPTLSLGYSQANHWEGRDFPVVRRPSGGRALWHDQEITYALVLPGAGDLPVSQVFCGITGALREALASLGAPVRCASELSGVRSAGCMATTRPGEIVSPLGKLVGCAQVRRGSRLLHHGVIPQRMDNERLAEVIPGHPPLHGLDDLACRLSPQALAEALGDAIGVKLAKLRLKPTRS